MGIERSFLQGEGGPGGVHQGHHGDFGRLAELDPHGIGPRHVGRKGLRGPLGMAQVVSGEQAVFRFHGQTTQGGIEDLGGHVRLVAAGIHHPDKDVLYLPAVGVGRHGEEVVQRRYVIGVRQKIFRRHVFPRLKDQKLSLSGGGYRILDHQGGGKDAPVLRAFDPQTVFSRRPQHLLRDGVQKAPVEPFGQKGVHRGDGAARFHQDLVHCGPDAGGGNHLALVAAAVLQMDHHSLGPGGGEVVFFKKADGHPVRVLQIGDELVRRGLVARGKLQRHRIGNGGGGILHDQQTGHHPESGDYLHHVPAKGRVAFVTKPQGPFGPTKSGGRGHALTVFSMDHGGYAVIHPKQKHAQHQKQGQQAQQNRPSPATRGGDFLSIRLTRIHFHALHHSTFRQSRPSHGE